jgi:hypothetical protein
MKRSLLAEEYITDDVLFVGTLRRLGRRCLDNEALQSIRVHEVIIQIDPFRPYIGPRPTV